MMIISMGFSELSSYVTYVKVKELVCQITRSNEMQTLKNLYLTLAEPEKVPCWSRTPYRPGIAS